MNRIRLVTLLALLTTAALLTAGPVLADEAVDTRVEQYLSTARVADGARELAAGLADQPQNGDLRFATGFMQFADAVQNLGRSWHTHGVRSQQEFAMMIPFLRLPVPPNPAPEQVTHEQARGVLERFVADLATAEATLAGLGDDDAVLGLRLGRGYLDFDGDGAASEVESLWYVYTQLNPAAGVDREEALDFLIRMDTGDLHWLRGYCHLLSAFLEFYLTFDDTKIFDHTAHLFFELPVTPFPYLDEPSIAGQQQDFYNPFIDAIALIHLIDLPVLDPTRGAKAREHLLEVIRLSRLTWELYGRETDDDHEWIPNPAQTGVIPDVAVTEDMIEQWHAFLDESEALLEGELLIPFWRGSRSVGLNLKKVFTEPAPLDLILWIQGTAVSPYLEEGPLTQAEFWERVTGAFGGRGFVGFALWFN